MELTGLPGRGGSLYVYLCDCTCEQLPVEARKGCLIPYAKVTQTSVSCPTWVLAMENRHSLQPRKITILLVCCEPMRISHTSGWPQTHYVAEGSIKPLIPQCFYFPSAKITGMCSLAWHIYLQIGKR